MRTRAKYLFSLIAVMLALAAVSGGANAQSYEYRQGYEQGYRDGLAAQRKDNWHDGWRAGPSIQVLSARYGTRYATCDATDSLRRVAGLNRNVDFVVNNNLCGDPAYGRPKRLYVEYQCGGGYVQHLEGRENEIVSMNCR